MEKNREPRTVRTHHIPSHLIADKGAKAIQWKKTSFFQEWYRNIHMHRKMSVHKDLVPFTKIPSRWIVDRFVDTRRHSMDSFSKFGSAVMNDTARHIPTENESICYLHMRFWWGWTRSRGAFPALPKIP